MKTTATEWTDTDDQIVEKYLGKKDAKSFEGLIAWAEWTEKDDQIVAKYKVAKR